LHQFVDATRQLKSPEASPRRQGWPVRQSSSAGLIVRPIGEESGVQRREHEQMTDQDDASYVIVGSEGLQASESPHDHPHGDMVDVRLRDGMVHYQTGQDVGGVTYRLGRGGALLIDSAKGEVVTVFGPAAWTWVTGAAAKGKVNEP
jgi:hypothetical protein